MEIIDIQAIEGANVYSHRPIIRAIVDLQEWNDRFTNELEDFRLQLVEQLPSLVEHYCSRGKRGGFLERLQEGTLIGHVIEHVTIELLTQAGQTIKYGKTMSILDQPGRYEIIFNYEVKEGAIEGFKQGFLLVSTLLKDQSFDVSLAVDRIKTIMERCKLGVSTQAIVDACQARGIPVCRMNEGSLLQLGYGRNQRRIQATITDSTSSIGVDIACDKEITKKILSEGGVPVPYGYIVGTEEEAVEAFLDMNATAVIKPLHGNQGKGVTLQLTNEAEVRAAFKVAQNYGHWVIIEEYIEGQHYRLVVVGDRLIAAAKRVPAHVVGDGISTIEELVAQTNKDPLRGEDHENVLTKITIDSVVLLNLRLKNLTLSSVPKQGEIVYLRDSANLSTGGIAEDVTDLVHPDNADLAVYAAKLIGLDVAGIDLVIKNIEASYREGSGHVIEVNAAPGIRMHHFPSKGAARDVGKAIVEEIIPAGNGRIPIVAISGTNGKTTTTRMISKILSDQKLIVGMTSTDGIYINKKLLVKGDMTGPESAKTVLRHPQVQVAVLETARGGILRSGLGYDYADVAVVTNVSNDHLGQYGIESLEDIAHVKSLVAEVIKPHSYVVLNADDPYVVQMAKRTQGRVIFFSTEKDNIYIRKHLGKGGIAVFVRRGMILLCQGSQVFKICSVKQIPVTWEGKAKHNIQNALAAIASGWALGMSTTAIRDSLQEFSSDVEHNRGRLNLYKINGVDVFIDYGHNSAGIQEIVNTLKYFKKKNLVGCVTVPGDRSDETVREVGRIAAKGFQRLVIREDRDLRGRKPGEIAQMIYDEAILSGMDAQKIKIILPETEAFSKGLDSCVPGDTFVMFYEHLEPIEEEIRRRMELQKALSYIPAKNEWVVGGEY
ncbi:cyanophycin synthetase [Desulfosporosinus orientis DSM 765]|uniref:Cyanophycin synthetase n=1 Tax=Desulfosporosinus orientis (strain ATCC 19365 / DSM 765 / NCIMB 8382 / VKM B-1628 / Singapore I) TaxID=768706 RepID=G7W7D9_DESOD|nr:cyanophycin synthetase [Desulfosporosinus orientis]AET65810.1 cyanophycin synthetase [Desulfosporosinus orientis DSM 765]